MFSILATLVGVDIGNAATRISRFANYLRNLVPASDVVLMEMTAKGMGILALSAGNHAAEYVDFETKRALEWLAGERHEGQRYSAVRKQFTVLSCILLCAIIA